MAAPHAYEFGPYRLDVPTHRLLRDAEPVSLTPKAFDILLALIERRDRVVDKAELLQLVWPDSFVEEANLSQTIFVLRKTLGEGPDGRPFIDTVPRRGYRFAADVREEAAQRVVVPELPTPATSRRRWMAAAVAVAVLMVAGVAVWREWPRPATDVDLLTGKTRVVVLPFENLTGNREDDWLASAFSDTLTSGLQGVENLIPVSRDRIVELYRQQGIRDASALDAGVLRRNVEALSVGHYVHGSYQRIGDRIKVVARLVDVDGTIRAQQNVTGDFANLLKLEDDLANRFSTQLAVGRPAVMPSSGTSSLEAYQAVVEARNAYAVGMLKEAEAHLQRTVGLDDRYAAAWALLSKTNARQSAPGAYRGGSLDAFRQAALTAAQRAVELHPSLYDAHTALALAYRESGQSQPWRAHAEQAIAVNPRLAEAYELLADYYNVTPAWGCSRGFDPALSDHYYRMAVRIDPPFSLAWGNWVWHLVWAGRIDESLRVAGQGLEALPTSTTAIQRARSMALVFGGRLSEAEQELRAVTGGSGPQSVYDQWLLATMTLKHGDAVTASKGFTAVLNAMPETSWDFRVALSHFFANDLNQGLMHLDRAVARNPACAQYAASVPLFAPYRDTPPFRARLAAWKSRS